jgi:polyhydroxyalkanoate synthesis regulator phasin
MAQERSGGITGGLRTGIGILAAVKEAVEETLQEAISRGDLSPDRALGLVRDTAEKVQSTLGEARDRLDIVSRSEYDTLQTQVAELKARVEALERERNAPRLLPEPTPGLDSDILVD